MSLSQMRHLQFPPNISLREPLYPGLGSAAFIPAGYHADDLVAQYFAQGMRLFTLFDRPRALNSFREAERLGCRHEICTWGVALALGPTLNTHETPAYYDRLPDAFLAATSSNHSLERSIDSATSDRDAGLKDAMSMRYLPLATSYIAKRDALDSSYALKMSTLVDQFPHDNDVAILTATALLHKVAPEYVDKKTGILKDDASRALELVDGVLRRAPDHAGALILYVMISIQLPRPGPLSRVATLLPQVAPGSPHAMHIASLASLRAHDVVSAQLLSWRAVSMTRQPYPKYYLETLVHLQVSRGHSIAALESSKRLAVLAESSQSDWEMGCPSERFSAQLPQVLIIFGHWDALLSRVTSSSNCLYEMIIWRVGRGVARISLGDRTGASDELSQVVELKEKLAFKIRSGEQFYGRLPVVELSTIHVLMLQGRLACLGDVTHRAACIKLLREAVSAYEALPIDATSAFVLSPHLVLGAALLNGGNIAEVTNAQKLFERQLRDHPHLGWALFGLQQACFTRGELECSERAKVTFETAWSDADIRLLSAAEAMQPPDSFGVQCRRILTNIHLWTVVLLVACLSLYSFASRRALSCRDLWRRMGPHGKLGVWRGSVKASEHIYRPVANVSATTSPSGSASDVSDDEDQCSSRNPLLRHS